MCYAVPVFFSAISRIVPVLPIVQHGVSEELLLISIQPLCLDATQNGSIRPVAFVL